MTSYPYPSYPSHPASAGSHSPPSPSPSQITLRITAGVPDSPSYSYSRSRSRPPSPTPGRRPDRETWTASMLGGWLERVEDPHDIESEAVAEGSGSGSGTGTRYKGREEGGEYGGGSGRDGKEEEGEDEEGEARWPGGGTTGGIEAWNAGVRDIDVSGSGVRGSSGRCSRCGCPWDAHDDGVGGDSVDTSSIQEDLHFTVKLSDAETNTIPQAGTSRTGSYAEQGGWEEDPDEDHSAEKQFGSHDDGNSDSPGWFRKAVYGLEGLNRLRSPRGNGTTSDQGQRLYSTPKTTICGACGRDRQLEHDWRNYYRAKCEKKMVDEERSSNGEKTTGYDGSPDHNSEGNGWG